MAKDKIAKTVKTTLKVGRDAALEAGPSLVDLLQPGAGIPATMASKTIAALFTYHAEAQTRRLLEELQERLAWLESQGKLDRERLSRLQADLGGLQALAANALSVEAKTELYADMLAGIVSTDVPEPVDVESFLATLQNLSVREVGIARVMYETWRSDPEQQAYGVYPPSDLGGHARYYMKRLEGAGLVEPVIYAGRTGAEIRHERYTLTPTLLQLAELLEAGRANPSEAETAGVD